MLTKGLGNNLHGIDEIIVISLNEYFNEISEELLQEEIYNHTNIKTRIITLENRTNSTVETICMGLAKLNKEFQFVIKDSDNLIESHDFLKESSEQQNLLGFIDIDQNPTISHVGKSYVDLNKDNFIINIIEKSVKSNLMNTGIVSFRSAAEFMSFGESALNKRVTYVSDVIKMMIQNKIKFKGFEIKEYQDWGTLHQWTKFKNSYMTIFVDLDGTLVVNSHPLAINNNNNWNSFIPLYENIDLLLKLQKTGRVQIIFTTSRSKNYFDLINTNLQKIGFQDFQLITGLFHSKRVLINDFSDSNVFPSAIAINIKRNTSTLSEYLNFLSDIL